jgi:hypothetical protein
MKELPDFIDQYSDAALSEFVIKYSVIVLIFIVIVLQYFIRYFCK